MVALLLLAVTAGLSADLDFRQHQAVQESLSRVHPRFRAEWLRERGLDDSYYATFHPQDSDSGLACVGRWPWGPSWELCGKGSLLFLGSGSGVRILSITDSIHPRQLGQIACRSLVSQLVIKDSLLFVACGSFGAQVYSVTDPASPRELGSIDATVLDLCVQDTFCYTVGGDSLRIYTVANPLLPVRLSAARDTNELLVASGHYVITAYDGMCVYDVANPRSPNLVNTRGGEYLTLFLRDTLLFCSSVQPSYFAILDVSDPLNIQQIGNISGYGGMGLYADDWFAYLSCTYDYSGIFVIDVTNPRNPQMRGSYNPEGTTDFDPYVPTPLSYGYLASDYGGLMVLDLHNPNTVTEAWSGYKADNSVDIDVELPLAVVANNLSGAQFLDVTVPVSPASLGLFDGVGTHFTATAVLADSYSFVSMTGIAGRRYLRSLDITEPSGPMEVAQESCRNPPEDMVLRDTLLYCAEVNQFQIFNVARPREPVQVGSCVTQDGVYFGLAVQDSYAYIAGGPTLQIVNIGNPSSPRVVGTGGRASTGIAVRDTFAYIPYPYDTLWVYSVSNPAAPVPISATPAGVWPWDIALADSIAVVATAYGLDLFSVTNPAQPMRLGSISTPYGPRRVVYSAPYFYAAMWDAGVGIYEAESVGIAEAPPRQRRSATALAVTPNPTRGGVEVRLPAGAGRDVEVRDVAGRSVAIVTVARGATSCRLDLDALSPGVYFVQVRVGGAVSTGRVVLTR
jgi:hypothetical protein